MAGQSWVADYKPTMLGNTLIHSDVKEMKNIFSRYLLALSTFDTNFAISSSPIMTFSPAMSVVLPSSTIAKRAEWTSGERNFA